MPTFSTRRSVPYSPRQMFDLVADVEKYPQFLPLCEGLTVRTREQLAAAEVLIASMTVGYKAIRESFTSRVTLQPAAPEIMVEYIDGPFKVMKNRWQFLGRADGGTDVDFWITYEFRSPLFSMLLGALFDTAFRKFAEAFEARARQVYGKPAARDVAAS